MIRTKTYLISVFIVTLLALSGQAIAQITEEPLEPLPVEKPHLARILTASSTLTQTEAQELWLEEKQTTEITKRLDTVIELLNKINNK